MLRKLLSAAGLLFSFGFLHAQQPDGVDYRALGAPLAPLRVVTETGKVYTENDAPKDENFFVMMFNPTCDHCQQAMHQLGKHKGLFRDGQILWVAAPDMIPHLEFFNNVTRYKNYPEHRVGVDSSRFIEKTFSYFALPQLNIYNRERKFIRMFTSEIPVDSLKPYLGPDARQWAGVEPAPKKSKKTQRGR